MLVVEKCVNRQGNKFLTEAYFKRLLVFDLFDQTIFKLLKDAVVHLWQSRPLELDLERRT